MQVNTNENTLIAKIVGLVIALVVVGMVLVPFVTEATTTERTFTNDGYYALNNIDNTAEFTMVWDTTAPTQVTVNDVVIPINPISGRYTLLGSDTLCVRYTAQDQMQAFGMNINDNYVYKSLVVSQGGTFTVTVSAGQVTVDVNGSTAIYPLGDNAYCIAPGDGDLVAVMKDSIKSAYVKGDSEIRLIGMSIGNNASKALGISGIGTIDDGMILSTLYVGSDYVDNPVTFTNITADYDSVNGYDDLYSLDKYTFTINYVSDGTDQTYDATYNYFIVPASVTAELTNHASNIEITLYQMIPILIVLGLVVAIVGMFAYNRYGN